MELLMSSTRPKGLIGISRLDDLMGVFKGRESQVLKLIINDHTLIKKNGKINISKIADAMELPRHEAEKIVKQMPFLS